MSRRLARPSQPPFSGGSPPAFIPGRLRSNRARRWDEANTPTARGERSLIAFVSNAGMCPPRFLTYELPAKITSMPYIHDASPPPSDEEPMVIKFWGRTPDPCALSHASRRSCAPRLTYRRDDAAQKESESSANGFAGGRGASGRRCLRIFMNLSQRALSQREFRIKKKESAQCGSFAR